MPALIPQLVKDTETGKICIMIKLGSEYAVHPLPENLAVATGPEIQEYMQGVIPDMVNNLRAQRQMKLRKLKKKANDA